ncbi:MAG: prepilin-type N-terminal cleavage/methylation domain-containing protein [Phycisphaerales bacterium]|nr:prepilin-type N-terminal cleavage/methylation domain-containing protein [Phycisphaerales bacterium]
MSSRPRQVGFTLVELLAVVVLLGLVAALAVGVVGPLAAGQRRVLAESTLREAVQRARTTASRQGGCALRLGSELTITGVRTSPSGRTATTSLPKGWAAHAGKSADEAGGPSTIAFGPDGVTQDSTIHLTGPRGERIALHLRGLSGAVVRAEVEP